MKFPGKSAITTMLLVGSHLLAFSANAGDIGKSKPRANLEQGFQGRLEGAGHKVGEVVMKDGDVLKDTKASWSLETVKGDTSFVYSGHPDPQTGLATGISLIEVQKSYFDNKEGLFVRQTHDVEKGTTFVAKFTQGADGTLELVPPPPPPAGADTTGSASAKSAKTAFNIM